MSIDSPRFGSTILKVAWVLFIASLWLPAVGDNADSTAAMTGWEAILMIGWLAANPWIFFADCRFLLLLICPVGCVCMLFAPILRMLWQENSIVLGIPLIGSAIVPLLLPSTLPLHFFVGFWCWSLSIVLMSIGLGIVSFTDEY